MKYENKGIIIIAVMLLLSTSVFAFGQTTSDINQILDDVYQRINQVLARIEGLNNQIESIKLEFKNAEPSNQTIPYPPLCTLDIFGFCII